jgi:hypothetical protein
MEDHSDSRYVGMDCNDSEQFYYILRNIWSQLSTENSYASFNFIGRMKDSNLPKRPKKVQKNPLGELGISVISRNPISEKLLYPKSYYRDPCFFDDEKLILASSSDHLSIFTNLSNSFITHLNIDCIIQNQSGSLSDL